MSHEEYAKVVEHIEEPLGPWAKRSFEPFSPEFVDGGNYYEYYADQYADTDHRPRIENRTPLQIERDRVLYSGGMRKLTEKYHVLYSGDRRITRNFTTHTMRMAQVARAISNGLRLNADFAEAIALGAKVGAPPFVHASKHVVATWLRDRLEELDKEDAKISGLASGRATEKKLFFDTAGDSPLPGWLSDIQSKKIADAIRRFIPFAVGKDVDEPYSSGSEGYWNLATDPYLVQSRPKRFAPETMFGIWRHSLSASLGPETFLHRIDFDASSAQKTQHQIRWDHVTYEALVVRYADDMTWVIENLDDAHRASALASGSPMYNSMHEYLREQGKVPPALTDALLEKDSGSLYNYFITDFIASSREILNRLKDGAHYRQSLREGSSEARISLTPQAEDHLVKMKKFLEKRVFDEPRVSNRFQILKTISQACLDLLYGGRSNALESYVEAQAGVLNFRDRDEKMERVKELLNESVHRVQLAADIFSQMSDQEIYDFVGIQGL